MSTLKTHNLQSPDAGSVNIAMTPNAGMVVTGISTFNAGVGIEDSIFHLGDDNTKIRFPAADTFTVETAGIERLRIGNDGTLSKYYNSSTVQAAFGGTGQVNGITALPSMAGNPFVVGRDTGTTRSAHFAGHLQFDSGYGIQGTEFSVYGNTSGLYLNSNVSGDAIIFQTHNGSSVGERLRIHSGGIVTVGDSGGSAYGGQMVVSTATGGVLTCADTGSGERLRLEGGSGIGRIGTDSNHDLVFITNGTSNERLRIMTDGELRTLSENGNNSDTPGITFRGGNSTQKANFARIHSRMVSGWGGQLQFKVKNDTGGLSDAYQTAMIMDHNGAVTKPNTVAFHATHAGNQSLSSGDTITTWSTTDSLRAHATGGASISSGIFTSPVTGVYVFHAQFLLSNASNTTGIHMVWKKNNQTFTYFNSRFNGNQIGYGGYVPVCGATTMHLDSGETCRITISYSGTNPNVYGTDYNWGFWDGYLLG